MVPLQGRGKTTIGNIGSKRTRALLLYQTTRVEVSDLADAHITNLCLSIPHLVQKNHVNTAKEMTDEMSFWKLSWPSNDARFANKAGHRLPPSMTVPKRQYLDGSSASGYVKYMVTTTFLYEPYRVAKPLRKSHIRSQCIFLGPL